MSPSIACPECGKKYRFPPGKEGRKVRCSACSRTFLVSTPAPSLVEGAIATNLLTAENPSQAQAPSPGEPSAAIEKNPAQEATRSRAANVLAASGRLARRWRPGVQRWWRDDRVGLHTAASCLWLLVGLNLVLASPRIGLLPVWLAWPLEYVLVLPVVVTALLIAWNLAAAIRRVGRTGKILAALPLTILQFFLFTLLFPQLAIHLGTSHFRWSETPALWEWGIFSLAHALRAGDIIDFLEAYHLHIQTIQHASWLAGTAVIAFHLLMDFFFLGLFMTGAESIKEKWKSKLTPAQARRLPLQILSVFLVVWLLSAFWIRPWQWRDILLWPIENLLKIVDVADLMQVYNVHLQHLPDAFWENTLTSMCRFLMWFFLIDLLTTWKTTLAIRYLGGYGLAGAELEKLRTDHPDEATRNWAAARLTKLADNSARDRDHGFGLGEFSPAFLWRLRLSSAALLVLAVPLCFWQGTIDRLAQNGVAPDDSRAYAAYYTLSRLGTYGEAAVPILEQGFAALPRPQQLWVVWTMGRLGQDALPFLEARAIGLDEELALHCARALSLQGARAAPALARATISPFPNVGIECKTILARFGRTSSQDLIDSMNQVNVGLHLPLIAEFDPYWIRASSANPYFHEVVAAWHVEGPKVRMVREMLQGPAKAKAIHAFQQLKSPTYALAVPELIALIDPEKGDADRQVLQTLTFKGGPAAASAAPTLVHHLVRSADKISIDYGPFASALGGFGEVVLPILQVLLQHPKALVRGHAAQAVANCASLAAHHKLGTNFSATVPLLEKMLAEGGQPAFYAVHALTEIGPQAASAVPLLVSKRADAGMRHYAEKALDKVHPRWRKSAGTELAATIESSSPSQSLPKFLSMPEEEKKYIAVASLAEMLRTTSHGAAAARVLWELKTRGKDASPALPAVLDFACRAGKSDNSTINHVQWVLDAAPMTPQGLKVLESMLSHKEQHICHLALYFLEKIDAAQVRPLTPAFLQAAQAHPPLEAMILQRLTAIDAFSEATLALFLEKLADPGGLRFDAMQGLVKMGPRAVPGLIRKLSDARQDVRSMAMVTLRELGNVAEPAIAELERIAATDNGNLREQAKSTLARIRSKGKNKK